jgi:hypothetical protein
MASTDTDGMTRVDLEWTIEGRKGIRTGQLYGLHFAEVLGAKAAIKGRAKRGDTVTIREI